MTGKGTFSEISGGSGDRSWQPGLSMSADLAWQKREGGCGEGSGFEGRLHRSSLNLMSGQDGFFSMKKKIKDEIKKLGAWIIYLFGSRAAGRGSALSDVDIGVVLKNPPVDGDTRALYNKLYGILGDQYPGSKMDLVFLERSPLALQFFAIRDGKILFEEDPWNTADYECQVIRQYLDFRLVLDLFDNAAAERYGKE